MGGAARKVAWKKLRNTVILLLLKNGEDTACPVCGGFGYKIRVEKTH